MLNVDANGGEGTGGKALTENASLTTARRMAVIQPFASSSFSHPNTISIPAAAPPDEEDDDPCSVKIRINFDCDDDDDDFREFNDEEEDAKTETVVLGVMGNVSVTAS